MDPEVPAEPQKPARPGASAHRRPKAGKSAAGIAIAVLAALYTFLAPMANERFGWKLPDLRKSSPGDRTAQVVQSAGSDSQATAEIQNERDGADGTASEYSSSKSTATTPPDAGAENAAGLKYGLLKDLGGQRYMSPAGLIYGPGSAEGHRLKHVERHASDQPGRPGSHGVFDGGMQGTLETIDAAYVRAKSGQRTTTRQDGRRTIHTVDMGRRVGYVGGRDGNRRRNPMARRVQLVLEDQRVITAYPK
ncbi:hypothetical protein [Crateriforma spongiae]|uniref:hypothetical protein n=1 Tax=Crateriforma spongiae TaxID=2724528 RepID=UPI00197D62A1|nr:hypothetical protein [Crateriforma spongiae]